MSRCSTDGLSLYASPSNRPELPHAEEKETESNLNASTYYARNVATIDTSHNSHGPFEQSSNTVPGPTALNLANSAISSDQANKGKNQVDIASRMAANRNVDPSNKCPSQSGLRGPQILEEVLVEDARNEPSNTRPMASQNENSFETPAIISVRSCLTPKGAILRPANLDVLLGRGRPFHLHPGNQKMHRIVDQYRPEYMRSRRIDKVQIAIIIVREIQDAGGRFLKKDGTLYYWYPVDDSTARKKVSHLLRERPNKAQIEAAVALSKAASEAAKIPPVVNESIALNADGNPASSTEGKVASDFVSLNSSGSSSHSIGKRRLDSNPGKNLMPSSLLPNGNTSLSMSPNLHPSRNPAGINPWQASWLRIQQSAPNTNSINAPPYAASSAVALSSLQAAYQHHRYMLDHHIRQLARHPLHNSPGAKPFEMPPLPFDLQGQNMQHHSRRTVSEHPQNLARNVPTGSLLQFEGLASASGAAGSLASLASGASGQENFYPLKAIVDPPGDRLLSKNEDRDGAGVN